MINLILIFTENVQPSAGSVPFLTHLTCITTEIYCASSLATVLGEPDPENLMYIFGHFGHSK